MKNLVENNYFLAKHFAKVSTKDIPRGTRLSRVVEITKKVILDQDQVQAIYFDLRSDQGQIF